jgi:hypothetical protein
MRDEQNECKTGVAPPRARAPYVGETVIVDLGDREFNGTRFHPAVVVRSWGDGANGRVPCVNCRVLVDGNDSPLWLTSIVHKSEVQPPTRYRQPRPVYYAFLGTEMLDD